jgi:hypothetical protein
MASATDLNTRSVRAGTFGNVNVEIALLTLANGDGNPSTHNILKLPAGVRPFEARHWITDASNASVTLNVGLKSVSGTNQDDNDYFYAALSLAATGTGRQTTNAPPIVLQQDMLVQCVVGGAAVTEAVSVTFAIIYDVVGTL